jgi:hypothetical protein
MPAAELPHAGYSARPLAEKLGYRDGQAAAFVALPVPLAWLAGAAAFGSVTELPNWSAPLGPAGGLDLVHAFTRSRAEIEAHLGDLRRAIRPDGTIWVSWPKKAARVPTDVTEDTVRAAALGLDLVDVKVAAIDAVWSGLKLVVRRERR